MSEPDYMESASFHEADYLILESSKSEKTAFAVQRLNNELTALIDLLSSHNETVRKELIKGFLAGLSVYSENQTKASQVVSDHCPEHLRGKLLDIIMFVRSRMNAVDIVTGDITTSAYYIDQVLDLF